MLICLMMLMIAVQEGGPISWLPTYAIKSGISTAEQSSIYSIYYGLPNSISRFAWIFIFKCSVRVKLTIITTTLSILAFVLVILQHFELYSIVCIVGPVVFGGMLGCFLSLVMTLCLDYGIHSNTKNNANFMMAYCIGEGVLLAPVGYLMR